ncbi:sigma-54 factor interaction domain-containing protein, partial [bacterium]|nr:sigma-54 factor interaction domain-containing protein [bacterium]
MLWAVLSTILDKRRAAAEERLRRGRPLARPRLTDFVSASPAMRAFMNVVRRVVPTDSSLLILGETGAGKERLARAIHAEGLRGHEPFVTINCGALPETLLESELFGHEEGSFTGATRTRRGLFELAHRGTVFLDEIGETPHHLQVKLLHALQEHEIQRIGGERP